MRENKKIKNYFPLPNEIFGLELESSEIAIYAYLLFRENRKTYKCYPSYRTIGSAENLSENTVRKYVYSLIEKGLITAEQTKVFTKDGLKRNGNLLYHIRPISEAIDLKNKKLLKELDLEQEKRQILEKAKEKLA